MRKIISPNWASEIRSFHDASGLSQVEFALKIGVERSTLQNWEHGRAVPRRRTILRVRAICRPPSGHALEQLGEPRRYSSEAIASLHQALDMILDNAPSEMVKDVSEYLTKRAGYYGGPPDRPESRAVPEKDKKKRSSSHV